MWKPRFMINFDDLSRKIRPFELVARVEFLVCEILRFDMLRLRLWKARKISSTKFRKNLRKIVRILVKTAIGPVSEEGGRQCQVQRPGVSRKNRCRQTVHKEEVLRRLNEEVHDWIFRKRQKEKKTMLFYSFCTECIFIFPPLIWTK